MSISEALLLSVIRTILIKRNLLLAETRLRLGQVNLVHPTLQFK